MKRLKINESYLNSDIVDIFKCSPQGGMRRSHRTNTLVLVSNQTDNNPYKDEWQVDTLLYTGMGLKGDQNLDYAQNKTLANSQNNGIEVHLFEVNKPKEYVYKGIVELSGEPFLEFEEDKDGNERKVYKFPLKIK